MPSFDVFMSLVVIIFVLTLSCRCFITEAAPRYRIHDCPHTTTFTPNSTYKSNLNILLSSLASNATGGRVGYYNTSVGRDPATVVYGSFLCRGDITGDQCRNCVATAVDAVTRQYCREEKVAIIWYQECTLRYSNESFFGNMDEVPTFNLSNHRSINNRPELFIQMLANMLNELVAAAAAGTPPGAEKFATTEKNFSVFQTIYSLVQCTPDLSSSDCNRCLRASVAVLPSCCPGKQGANILYPSCNIRYELYPFYNTAAAPIPKRLSPPPPAASGSGSGGNNNRKNFPTIINAICASIAVASLLFLVGICYWKRAKDNYNAIQEELAANEIPTVESLQFDLATIRAATKNFSDGNKLGEGGFGVVYKGMLPNGQEIAVKRLSRSSAQGSEEFKNEVVLVARLQHRNLTRLLGFCLEGEEKVLVYEFVPNKSLDNILFDQTGNKTLLDWSRRYKVISGISRGILYLHEDSRLRIIHRDLKSGNILLDQEMNPKISDFGMAKLCGVDQTQGNTSRIVGTYGYMAPEYAYYGQFSVKSDVFSFGVLIMEIITGKKNSRFLDSENREDLLNHAWRHWRDGTPLELLDERLRYSYKANEVIRCVHIGLLCVQADPADRPTMASIVLMLSSYSVTLPLPKKPASFPHSRTKPNMPSVELESDYSTGKKSCTINEMSFSTEIYPR